MKLQDDGRSAVDSDSDIAEIEKPDTADAGDSGDSEQELGTI